MAAVGDVVGVALLQALSVSAGGGGLTVKLTAAEPVLPDGVGVAVRVPE